MTKANVLIVDDDAALLRLLALSLAEHGHQVATALNGRQALDKLDEHEPDAIVLDLEMPVMDGREFFREMRARGKNTPVLILSAHDSQAAQRELGAEAYMNKPFDPEELAAAVYELAKAK